MVTRSGISWFRRFSSVVQSFIEFRSLPRFDRRSPCQALPARALACRRVMIATVSRFLKKSSSLMPAHFAVGFEFDGPPRPKRRTGSLRQVCRLSAVEGIDRWRLACATKGFDLPTVAVPIENLNSHVRLNTHQEKGGYRQTTRNEK